MAIPGESLVGLPVPEGDGPGRRSFASAHPEMKICKDGHQLKFPIQKSAIFCKVKEIKGLRGDVQVVRRTRNPADRHRDCGKGPFLDGN
jgi:hypothetical protein